MITIIGATGKIQDVNSFMINLHKVSQHHKISIQVFNASYIFGKDHLLSAYEHARRSFKQGTNATNTLAMEILLYAAGERQIQKALRKLGLQKGLDDIVLLFIGAITQKNIENSLLQLGLKRNDKVLEGNLNTLKNWGFSQQELATVSKENRNLLILEKVALVDIIK